MLYNEINSMEDLIMTNLEWIAILAFISSVVQLLIIVGIFIFIKVTKPNKDKFIKGISDTLNFMNGLIIGLCEVILNKLY